ncbi:SiaB family protein kinase [Cellvibrio sp. NN19]|uniref:SiaB family protein kinase n=1 Tax=Cellvibrio chitinivorans TaxID=3102792 RepID=UPI002B409ED3|nr:SiaB family protein kinase [Cellvibrio sp. NN19]
MNSNSPIVNDQLAFCEIARQHRVIFYYVGYFSQNIVAAMADAVKLQLEVSGANGPTRRKLFSSFIEMAQNIIHYSADALTPDEQMNNEMRHGSVCISEKDGQYILLCANPIDAQVADDLRTRLDALRGMTMDEIKRAYKESLRGETHEGSKGAGLGFLTMARDACEPLEFEFWPMEQRPQAAMFYLKAAI